MPHVCPWWGGYFIDNPLRRLLHNPDKIVGPYVMPGMTVMDVGFPKIARLFGIVLSTLGTHFSCGL